MSHYAAQFTSLAESRVTARKYAVSPLYRASRVFLHRLFLLRDTHTMLCPHDLFHSRIPIRRRSRLILVRSESQLVRSGTGDSRHTGPARRQACQIEETEPSAHFGFHRQVLSLVPYTSIAVGEIFMRCARCKKDCLEGELHAPSLLLRIVAFPYLFLMHSVSVANESKAAYCKPCRRQLNVSLFFLGFIVLLFALMTITR